MINITIIKEKIQMSKTKKINFTLLIAISFLTFISCSSTGNIGHLYPTNKTKVEDLVTIICNKNCDLSSSIKGKTSFRASIVALDGDRLRNPLHAWLTGISGYQHIIVEPGGHTLVIAIEKMVTPPIKLRYNFKSGKTYIIKHEFLYEKLTASIEICK